MNTGYVMRYVISLCSDVSLYSVLYLYIPRGGRKIKRLSIMGAAFQEFKDSMTERLSAIEEKLSQN